MKLEILWFYAFRVGLANQFGIVGRQKTGPSKYAVLKRSAGKAK